MLHCMNPQGLYLFPLNTIPQKNQASASFSCSVCVSVMHTHAHTLPSLDT